MTKIVATPKKQETFFPHAGELEVTSVMEVTYSWETPEGFSQTKKEYEGTLEVVSPDGEHLAYLSPSWWVFWGTVYRSMSECAQNPAFDGHGYKICFSEERAKEIAASQLDAEDWGD
jgi:hypothetical protein